MPFAPPHSTLTPQVMGLIEVVMSNAPSEHHVHYLNGLEQIRAFMLQTHGNPNGTPLSFEDMVARDSSIWQEHFEKAKSAKDTMASVRPTLDFLPNIAGIDIRVHSRGRPDDAIYNSSEYARKFLPRGNYIAQWKVADGRALYFPMIRAYPKFTGHEDDGELLSTDNDTTSITSDALSKYFTEPASETQSVITTTKENGEAAHLAVLKLDNGSYVYLVGSKNVHLAIQSARDIEPACLVGVTAPGQNPFAGAKAVAYGLMRMLDALEPAKRFLFCEFLWQTRLTASFELLCPDHQHVELLDVAHETPVLFGYSFPTMQTLPGAEICVNPLLGFALSRACGIRTVAFDVVPYTGLEFKNVLTAIKSGYQTEGNVNLYVNGRGNVIGLQKYKTAWYVSLRAIREKAKAFLTAVLGKKHAPIDEALRDSHRSIEKRFKAIQRFLQLTDDSTAKYCALGVEFVTYVARVRLASCGNSDDAKKAVQHDCVNLFPVVWRDFLVATGANDRIDCSV
ncbi:hypothetical protein H310_09874 [Aphanomyces invadans]|uniref:DUF7920 domain-containing protein n=1 Tax=Aphanomyces invadans TaxID=157072 RepID=A0A024TSB4_9STRA|nr:hypothetical protein H310_09874 [Aphanomyces invadans]ETV97045.1 hypothetical protein H310_09874 [Aphanomyces invadans]|eukprot:XP_008874291.1 hypothetical protein H310_09874 [Aphanomyces invadans]